MLHSPFPTIPSLPTLIHLPPSTHTHTHIIDPHWPYREHHVHPHPEILKLSMVIIVVPSILAILFYMLDTCVIKMLFGKFISDCIRNNLRGSNKIFLGGMPPDHPSRHAHLCMCKRAFTCYYYPATILFPPVPTPLPLPTQNPVWNLDPPPQLNYLGCPYLCVDMLHTVMFLFPLVCAPT